MLISLNENNPDIVQVLSLKELVNYLILNKQYSYRIVFDANKDLYAIGPAYRTIHEELVNSLVFSYGLSAAENIKYIKNARFNYYLFSPKTNDVMVGFDNNNKVYIFENFGSIYTKGEDLNIDLLQYLKNTFKLLTTKKSINEILVYAGSAIDYIKPSYKAIGSGEGYAEHGWGFYYSKNKHVADRYRVDSVIDQKNISFVKYKDETFYKNNPEDLYYYQVILKAYSMLLSPYYDYVKKDELSKLYQDLINNNQVTIDNELISLNNYNSYLEDDPTDAYYLNKKEELEQFISNLESQNKEYKKLIQFIKSADFSLQNIHIDGGVTKQFEIPDGPYLEEELHISKQSEEVKRGLYNVCKRLRLTEEEMNDVLNTYGAEIYYNLCVELQNKYGYDYKIKQGNGKRADKIISRLLNSEGIKGIHYFGDRDGECYVLFNPIDIKPLNEQLAYHGSIAEFDKFSLDKFNRGDYGYGIYFTKDKGYAQNYGTVKQYEIPDMDYLLDIDISMDYQSDYIQQCSQNIIDGFLKRGDLQSYNKFTDVVYANYCNTGWNIYEALWDICGSAKQASEFLDKNGIKGIDASFRHNCFVIFNPDNIEIREAQMDLNRLKNLNESIDKILNEDIAIYTTTAKGIIDVEFPNHLVVKDVPATFYTNSKEYGYKYDRNIYGVEDQYAVGGYVGGTEEYEESFDIDSVDEIDFDSAIKVFSEEIREELKSFIKSNNYLIKNIRVDEKSIVRDFQEFEPEEPDYD